MKLNLDSQTFGEYGTYYPTLKLLVIVDVEYDEIHELPILTGSRLYENVEVNDLPLHFPKEKFLNDYCRYGFVGAEEKVELIIKINQAKMVEIEKEDLTRFECIVASLIRAAASRRGLPIVATMSRPPAWRLYVTTAFDAVPGKMP